MAADPMIGGDLPGTVLDSLAERGVRLRVRDGRLEGIIPDAARSERLSAWIDRHRDELIAMACGSCGAIPYAAFTSDGEPRCAACAPSRCRRCYVEVSPGATMCCGCAPWEPPALTPADALAAYAASKLPRIRFTVHERTDGRDLVLLDEVRTLIGEYEPGGNCIDATLLTLDGRRVVVRWRAVAARELRRAIAGALARHALAGVGGSKI